MFDKIANTVYLFTVLFMFMGAITQDWNNKTHKIIATIFVWLCVLSFILFPTQILIDIWSD